MLPEVGIYDGVINICVYSWYSLTPRKQFSMFITQMLKLQSTFQKFLITFIGEEITIVR